MPLPTLSHYTVLSYDKKGRLSPDIELFDLQEDAEEERDRLCRIWQERGETGRHVVAEVEINAVPDDDEESDA